MKIGCHCGATIYDQTDFLPHKAHIIPDQEWFNVYDAIDDDVIDALIHRKLEQEAAYLKARGIIGSASRQIWQCNQCGRLYIDDQAGKLQCYLPATAETSKAILCKSNSAPTDDH